MKLNMWMIANRLTGYDVEKKLEQDAEAVINSALPVYIPGCVRIRAVGPDVVCEHEQGWIRIRDLGISDGYMLIQSIFDWYQERLDRIDDHIMSGDYQALAEEYHLIFGNPVMIQDSNYRLLGMSESFSPGEIPPEWDYIRTHGQSSAEGYQFMSHALLDATARYRQNVRRFQGVSGSRLPYGGLHGSVRFNNREYAKLTVLEYNRPLNPGDVRLMEYLTRRLAIYEAAAYGQAESLDRQMLERMLTGAPIPPEQISYYQSLLTAGQSGRFAILAVRFSDSSRQGDPRAIQLLHNIMTRQYPTTACCEYRHALVSLLYSPNPFALAFQQLQTLHLSGYEGQLLAGVSLSFDNLADTAEFCCQAFYAMDRCTPPESRYFYQEASNYILSSTDQRQRLLACEPELRMLWQQEPDKRDYLQTLAVYLDMERAAAAAAQRLFIHKNTLNYRIRYLRERTGWDLDNPVLRTYLRLSLYVLSCSDS